MITPSFGLTATERVLPKLALDFTTASLDSRITFTRTTGASNPATYTDSSGLVTAATNNQPRFDYDPITLACKGLLIEEGRTNTATYSSDFTQTAWTKNAVTINADAVVAPDGTTTADQLVENTTTNDHWVYRTLGGAADYSGSVYAKAEGRSWVVMRIGGLYAYFDLANGVMGTVDSGLTASIRSVGNGWYRLTISRTMTGAGVFVIGATTGNGVVSYLGTGIPSISIWGAQFEAGAFATSYIPTTTTALTRNADVATMTGTNFSDWWNNSAGAFAIFWDQYFLKTTGIPFVFAAQGSLRAPQTTNGTRYYGQTSGNTFALGNITTTAQNGVCVAYAANTAEVLSSKGSSILTNSGSFTGAAPTQFAIGHDGAGANQISGHFQKLLYWPQRLTNAEVQAFSKG